MMCNFLMMCICNGAVFVMECTDGTAIRFSAPFPSDPPTKHDVRNDISVLNHSCANHFSQGNVTERMLYAANTSGADFVNTNTFLHVYSPYSISCTSFQNPILTFSRFSADNRRRVHAASLPKWSHSSGSLLLVCFAFLKHSSTSCSNCDRPSFLDRLRPRTALVFGVVGVVVSAPLPLPSTSASAEPLLLT